MIHVDDKCNGSYDVATVGNAQIVSQFSGAKAFYETRRTHLEHQTSFW